QHPSHDDPGRRLLAHELVHTIQQGAVGARQLTATKLQRQPARPTPAPGVSPLVQKFLRGEATDAEKAILRQQLKSGQMSAADFEALKSALDDQFRASLKKALPQIVGAGQAAPAQVSAVNPAGSISVQFGGSDT